MKVSIRRGIGRWIVAWAMTLLAATCFADGTVPGYILVRVQPGVDAAAVARRYGTTIRDQVPGTLIYSFETPAGKTEEAFAEEFVGDTQVVFAEADTYLNGPEFNGNPFHFAFDSSALPGGYINQGAYSQVNFVPLDPAALQFMRQGIIAVPRPRLPVIVAVLDTGATYDHPALVKSYLPGYNAILPGTSAAELADGVNNLAMGHGTFVAGIILRIAPMSRILPVRVLNADGVGTALNVAKGLFYAINNGARVVNMSFGATKLTSVMSDALDEAELKGVVVVAPAGNEGLEEKQFPAAGHGALAVASIEEDNTKSSYSNYGSFVRVVAPGTGIRSCYYTGGYVTWSGTSFAAPFVAGEAAQIISARPKITVSVVKDVIRNTARSVDSVNPAYRGRLGKGLIDIRAALRTLR